jgi:hypothetical protein
MLPDPPPADPVPEDRAHLVAELGAGAGSKLQPLEPLLDLDAGDVAELVAAPSGFDVVLQVALVALPSLLALAIRALLGKLLYAVVRNELREGSGAGHSLKARPVHERSQGSIAAEARAFVEYWLIVPMIFFRSRRSPFASVSRHR